MASLKTAGLRVDMPLTFRNDVGGRHRRPARDTSGSSYARQARGASDARANPDRANPQRGSVSTTRNALNGTPMPRTRISIAVRVKPGYCGAPGHCRSTRVADDRARPGPRSRECLRAGAVRRRNSSRGPVGYRKLGPGSWAWAPATSTTLDELQDGLDGTVHMVVAGPVRTPAASDRQESHCLRPSSPVRVAGFAPSAVSHSQFHRYFKRAVGRHDSGFPDQREYAGRYLASLRLGTGRCASRRDAP